ncbi:MAG: hypothetical protein AAFY46_06420, partial [Planctomycetota bacterium]
NPNVYAGDWTLLRHATLLKAPSLTYDDGSITDAARLDQLGDNDLQINQQVAADSIFRSEAFWGEPFDSSNGFDGSAAEYAEFSAREAQAPPTFASGIVDIATQTLPEVRRRVKGLAIGSSPVTSSDGGSGGFSSIWVETPIVKYNFEGRRSRWERLGFGGVRVGRATSPSVLYDLQLQRFTNTDPSDDEVIVPNDVRQSLVHLQHAWMGDALPAASNEVTYASAAASAPEVDELTVVFRNLPVSGGQPANANEPASPLFATRTRMRYESVPPGYNADVFGQDAIADFESDREDLGSVLLAAARADQQMVTNSQFIPRCTEFIVEWSFGERYTANLGTLDGSNADAVWSGDGDEIVGELIWYGLPRPASEGVPIASIRPRRLLTDLPDDLDEPGEVPTAANPLSIAEQRLLEKHLRSELIQGDPDDLAPNSNPPGNSLTRYRQVAPSPDGPSGTIGGGIARTAAQAPATYYFGYADPRAVPVDDFELPGGVVVANRGFDVNGDGFRDDLDGDGVYDDAWPWPRLLRITMSFADPVDQTVEDTFQFVVELPRDGDL